MERQDLIYHSKASEHIYLNTFEFGTKVFKDFKGEEIDRYMFARVIEYVVDCGKIKGTDWIPDVIEKVEDFCRKENILTWSEALDVLVNSDFIIQFNVPVKRIRSELEAELKEWGEFMAQIEECKEKIRDSSKADTQ